MHMYRIRQYTGYAKQNSFSLWSLRRSQGKSDLWRPGSSPQASRKRFLFVWKPPKLGLHPFSGGSWRWFPGFSMDFQCFVVFFWFSMGFLLPNSKIRVLDPTPRLRPRTGPLPEGCGGRPRIPTGLRQLRQLRQLPWPWRRNGSEVFLGYVPSEKHVGNTEKPEKL